MTTRITVAPPASPQPTLRHVLRHVSRALQSQLRQRIEQFAVSEAEYVVLFTLKRVPDLSSADVSRWTGVTPQGANQIVKALLTRGLIQRARSAEHGRRLLLSLTAEGRRVIDACEQQADALEDEMCSEMPAGDRDQLMRLLQVAAAGLHSPVRMPSSEPQT